MKLHLCRTIKDNPILMIFVWRRKERQVTLKLNSNRIYILTSQSTVSSSEVVINSLNSIYGCYPIGELTEGKNVGMEMQKMINMNGCIGLLH